MDANTGMMLFVVACTIIGTAGSLFCLSMAVADWAYFEYRSARWYTFGTVALAFIALPGWLYLLST